MSILRKQVGAIVIWKHYAKICKNMQCVIFMFVLWFANNELATTISVHRDIM